MLDRIRTNAPKLDGREVQHVLDYRSGANSRPRWLAEAAVLEFDYGEQLRVLVRPSGTEPKLKIYVDYRSPASAHEPGAESRALDVAQRYAAQFESVLPR